MKVALCTVSFRHQLKSFSDLSAFAALHHFDGIELWGAHAYQLFTYDRDRCKEELLLMRTLGIQIPMISAYLDISSQEAFPTAMKECVKLIRLARWFGAGSIRIFAGHKPSTEISSMERVQYARRLRELCERCGEQGIRLLVETHPNTLADRIDATMELLAETDHDALGINYDFLHVWESGTDPVKGYRTLKPWIRHFHLKNVSSHQELSVFAPQNVFSASGTRKGMVALGEGAVDYTAIIQAVGNSTLFGSLEWFGDDPQGLLAQDIRWVRQVKEKLGRLEPLHT